MQEKESIMVVRCALNILSLRITVRHHSASLVMPNSNPRDGFSICISQRLKILKLKDLLGDMSSVALSITAHGQAQSLTITAHEQTQSEMISLLPKGRLFKTYIYVYY